MSSRFQCLDTLLKRACFDSSKQQTKNIGQS